MTPQELTELVNSYKVAVEQGQITKDEYDKNTIVAFRLMC